MSHDLTNHNGRTQFAYSATHGDPWHRLGTPVKGLQTLEAMLEASGCDDTVTIEPVYAQLADGTYQEIPGRYATVSDRHGPIATVGGQYNLAGQQRRDLARLGAEIVGRSGEACFDTMGNLGDNAERFFAYLRFDDLIIDPNGIADVISRGLVVATSFDGTMANTMGTTATRIVCANTLRVGLGNMSQAIAVKHTANAEARVRQAAAAVGYAAAVEAEMQAKAEAMLRVPGGPALDRILEAVWPADAEGNHSAVARNERDAVIRLYEDGALNAPLVGENGWAAYNALTEWVSWAKPVRFKGDATDAERQHKRTVQALDWSSRTSAELILAADAVLALAA